MSTPTPTRVYARNRPIAEIRENGDTAAKLRSMADLVEQDHYLDRPFGLTADFIFTAQDLLTLDFGQGSQQFATVSIVVTSAWQENGSYWYGNDQFSISLTSIINNWRNEADRLEQNS